MIDADKPQFFKSLAALAVLKAGGGKLTPDVIELYWDCLRDWPLEEFMRACKHLAKSCRYMPDPYDFEQLRKLRERPGAVEAWSLARSASSQVFYNGRACSSASSGDEFIDRIVMRLGGYQRIAMCPLDYLHTIEERFIECYEEISDREAARAALSGPDSHLKLVRK